MPLARSVYERTRGKSSATATVSRSEPMVADAAADRAAPAGAEDGAAAAAGRAAVPTSARTAAEATAETTETGPAEGNLGDMAPE